jgi:hypothetical protein
MKFTKTIIFLLLICLGSCGLKEREQTIMNKEKAVNDKEQQLILWEQQLTMREKELERKAIAIDSTSKQIDSMGIYNGVLVGKWKVKMECIETTCEGSAVGDIKNEQWEIGYTDNNNVIAKAYSGKNLTRIYNGLYRQNGLQMADQQATGESTIRVTLNAINDNKLEGRREILQPNCKIIYSLQLERA